MKRSDGRCSHFYNRTVFEGDNDTVHEEVAEYFREFPANAYQTTIKSATYFGDDRCEVVIERLLSCD